MTSTIQFVRDLIEDDQAIAIHIEDKGLVVLSGCAHAGIVNTVRYAQEISGVDRVWAILGGFHLAPADEDDFARMLEESLQPKKFEEGEMVEGRIVSVGPDVAFIDAALRYTFDRCAIDEAQIPSAGFSEGAS